MSFSMGGKSALQRKNVAKPHTGPATWRSAVGSQAQIKK
jgi:hypothetical protein